MTTSYRIPNLRYLQTKWLVATCLYVGSYYAVGVALLVTFLNDAQLRIASDIASPYFLLFMILGIPVMWQLVRLAVAIASRWQWHDATMIAHYQLDIAPIEAAVLLRVKSPTGMASMLLQSLVDKNVIRLVPEGRKVHVYDCLEDEKPLYYYEDYLAGRLLKNGSPSTMSTWQLIHGRHIRQTEEHIYEKLKWRGYFAKQSPLQEGLGQYLQIGAYYVLAMSIVVVLGVYGVSSGDTTTPTGTEAFVSQTERIGAVLATIAVTLGVPFLVFFRNVFTRQGTDKMSLALGFYWYLRTVYKHRLASGYELTESEKRQYGPYLDVFGLSRPTKSPY